MILNNKLRAKPVIPIKNNRKHEKYTRYLHFVLSQKATIKDPKSIKLAIPIVTPYTNFTPRTTIDFLSLILFNNLSILLSKSITNVSN